MTHGMTTDDTVHNHNNSNDNSKNKSKRIVLIRHGCTYMNEYLSKEGSRWGDPHFTDFFEPHEYPFYRDSPLSERGKMEALRLKEYLQRTEHGRQLIQDIEMIAISPLQRALQTAEIAVLPHFSFRQTTTTLTMDDYKDKNYSDCDDKRQVPIVALPLASERVYLISDQGSCKVALADKFPFADFSTEFKRFRKDWWFTTTADNMISDDDMLQSKQEEDYYHSFTFMSMDKYVEWRPNGRGQRYSCHGEPPMMFEERMMALYQWLEAREENVICLVSHWGVMDWLTGEDFDNCEIRDVPFEQIRAKVMKSRRL